MSWTITPSSRESIRALEARVPGEMPADDAEGNLLVFEVGQLVGDAVGFALFCGTGQTVELLRMGVLEEHRLQGAAGALLDEAARCLLAEGYTGLEVEVPAVGNAMLRLLLGRDFNIVGSDPARGREDLSLRLRRQLRKRREIRYALTERCCFRCIFCHNEGLVQDSSRKAATAEEVMGVLETVVAEGCTDITFTGGEPLLERERLTAIVAGLTRLESPPDVTVVTNGLKLNDEIISVLADYPGHKKINLSLHAADAETFRFVTGMKGKRLFDKVVDHARRAVAAGIELKVNHVVLRDHNNEQILEAIDLARDIGASAIKLLELLVLHDNAKDFDWFYDAAAVARRVEEVADERKSEGSLRRRTFVHRKDPRFRIEVQKCTCALGCARCREVRDYQLASDLAYHPCFVRSDTSMSMRDPASVPEVLAWGDRVLDDYALKFGNSSPTLILEEKYVADKREVFFSLDDVGRFEAFLLRKKLWVDSANQFYEEYYLPRRAGDDWREHRRVLKLALEKQDDSKAELLYMDHEYEASDGLIETRTRFLSLEGPLRFRSLEEGRHMLERFDFVRSCERDWRLQFWTDGRLHLNVARRDDGKSTVKVNVGVEKIEPYLALFEEYDGRLEPLREPLLSFVPANEAD